MLAGQRKCKGLLTRVRSLGHCFTRAIFHSTCLSVSQKGYLVSGEFLLHEQSIVDCDFHLSMK